MDQRLQDEAQALLARMHDLPPREPGEKLRPIDELRIVEMAQKGETQEAIAAVVRCDQSTVSRTVAKYQDTRPLARKRLEAEALNMVERLVTDAKPQTILKIMGKLDVVREDNERGVTVNNAVMIARPDDPSTWGPMPSFIEADRRDTPPRDITAEDDG